MTTNAYNHYANNYQMKCNFAASQTTLVDQTPRDGGTNMIWLEMTMYLSCELPSRDRIIINYVDGK